MHRLFRLVAAVLALAVIASPAAVFAQQTESRITGRVLDDSKAAIPGVTVTVTSKTTGAVRTTVTGGEGVPVVLDGVGAGICLVAHRLTPSSTSSADRAS